MIGKMLWVVLIDKHFLANEKGIVCFETRKEACELILLRKLSFARPRRVLVYVDDSIKPLGA